MVSELNFARFCSIYRNNLKELDEITNNLRQKLEVNPSQDETAPESEAMPLSTSSMLMTYGSTWTGGTTWGAAVGHVERG